MLETTQLFTSFVLKNYDITKVMVLYGALFSYKEE